MPTLREASQRPTHVLRDGRPAYWNRSLRRDKKSQLEQEQCVIGGEHFFIRGRIVIPVTDAGPSTEFDWGVWVSLSRDNFARAQSLWTTPGREREQPYFGWLSTELPLYQPTTLMLKTHVHAQPVGRRPLIELEPTDHPLAVEQRTGITLARVQQAPPDGTGPGNGGRGESFLGAFHASTLPLTRNVRP